MSSFAVSLFKTLPLLTWGVAATAQINVSFSVTEPSCFGLPDGSITAIPSGGAPPYTYVWNTGATVPTLNNIPAGAYSVTITSSNGFSGSNARTVEQPDLITIDFITQQCTLPLSVTAAGSGGSPPYSYHWSTGATTATLNNLPAGNYCITLTDASQCGTVDCITLNYTPVSVSVTVTPVNCPGGNNGVITAFATGGVAPFTFAWSNGATGASLAGLQAGSYTVTLTDAGGCTAVATGTVTQPQPLSLNMNPVNPTCAGLNNGSVSATASGGSPPYTYSWNTGQTGPFIGNLAPGTYSVTATDANGCPVSASRTLVQQSNLTAGALGTPETCPDLNNGFLTVSANNGVTPYAYLWSTGATTQVVTNVAPGNYTVTVTDALGCTGVANATVQAAPDFLIQVQGQNTSICSGGNGSATVNILSGSGPFTYNWSNGATTQTISNLAPGTYFVTVTNPNQCVATGSVAVIAPPELSVNIEAPDFLCPGPFFGSAGAVVTGGTPPFTYAWSSGQTTATINSLDPGSYSVTVTDAAFCTATDSITINEAPPVEVDILGNTAACGEGATGTATAVAISGTPPFTYFWDNLSTSQTITGLQQGNYSVTVTDTYGCKGSADFSLVVVEDLDMAVQGTNLNCFGNNSGTAAATGSGGAEPYTFLWSNGASGSAVSNLPAGAYSVTLTEANGCAVSATVNIAQPPLLQASVSTNEPLCPGDASGSLTASFSGGIPPYSILWNTGANTPTIQNLAAGDYSVTILDVNGCSVAVSSQILAFPALNCSIQLVSEVIGGNDGALTAQASGGAPPYSYAWNSGHATAAITGLAPGMYIVTITDSNGCSTVCNIDLVQLAGLGDFVWEDLNKNGIQETGEPGVEEVLVHLKDGNGQVIGTTLTDNTGYYEFIGLQTGSYSVMFTLPDGFHYTLIDATSNDSLDSDVDLATMEMTPPVFLTPNMFNPTLDAGIYRSPSNELLDPCHCLNNATTEQNGQFGEQITIISYPGETWQVIEATGMWDPNSPEPPGIPVPFGIGAFFTETSPGVYVLPFKLIHAIPYSAKLSNGTDILMIGNNCTYPTVNLSEIPAEMCIYDPPFVPTANPGVPGQMTYFINGEPVENIDPADLGIGLFEFVALLTPIDPDECQARIVSMISIVNNCFAQLGDYVWEDIDRDGIQDGSESGVPDVTVRLKNAQGTVIDSTLTNASGYYLFDSLPPAAYSVWFVLPNGYRFTVRNAGNDDTLDNDADMSTMGMSHTTTLETDETDLTLDAGIYLMPSPEISDPCNCLNNSTTEDNGQFTEEFTIHGYPGEVWRLIGNQGMYQLNSPEPPAAPILMPLNTIIQETAPGEYVLPFRLVDEETYTAVVTNGFDTLSISNTCRYPVVNMAGLPAELCISDAPFTPTVSPEMPGTTVYYVNGVEVATLDPQVLQPGVIEFTTVFIPDSPELCETRILSEIIITEDCLAKLGDYVWLDLDHDGRQDPGEPGIPNVKVIVSGVGSNYMEMTHTDNTGMYMFFVPPGTYKVTFGQPEGLIPTFANSGGNDATDSDMDPLSFMAPPVTLGPDEMNLTIDAGFYTLCENITQPGQIGYNQVLCGPGNDPVPFVSLAAASGGEGQIEYLWMKSTSGGNFNDGSWVPIPNSNSPGYDSGPLFVTTYFVRCARREDCTAYLESNILVVEIDNQAVANIGGPDFICQGEPHTFTAVGAGQNAVIQWNFGSGAIPPTATGHTVQVAYSSFGTFQITLTVTENGCTASNIATVVVTNSPTACPDVMDIDVEVIDQEARMIQVSWEVRADGLPLDFTVQHAADGVNFSDIGFVNTPSAVSGGNRKFSFLHQTVKMGRNYYRVMIRDHFGHSAWSETGSAILYGDSKLAVAYPNPVKDKMTLELFETFGEPVQVELIGINGVVLQKHHTGKEVERLELDLSPYPAGAYLIRLKFGKTHVKTLRVVRMR